LIDPVGSIDKRRPIFRLTADVSIHYQRVGFAAELHNPEAELGVAGAEMRLHIYFTWLEPVVCNKKY
jgi:hypothetical protein